MAGRQSLFKSCTFHGNSARFAGAVRVNDIGSATFEDCTFVGNRASGRGGAVITQIEKPDQQSVVINRSLFCFNESPMSPHIYNYRSTTHKCKKCKFNSKECCSSRGRVVAAEDAAAPTALDQAHEWTRVCDCEPGWSGARCETSAGGAANAGHAEL